MVSEKFESALKSSGTGTTTLGDVARLAEVSPATVSRCLNNPQSVRPEKRARILQAVETLDYVPHAAARALASRRSRMIGAVFPSLDSALFGGALEAFQKEIAASGYTVVVASSGYDPDAEQVHVRNLLESGVEGLMLIGGRRSEAIYRLIDATGIPYVLTWVSKAPGKRPCIGFDNAAAAAHLTQYLYELGHRRFAVLSGFTEHNDRAAARLDGVAQFLAARGAPLDPDLVFERRFDVDDGREAFRLMMARDAPPTALVCGSEPLAYGAVFEALEAGIRVPQDISIAGFDDMWLAAQMTPALTTVQTPRTEMGRDAARYLLARLSGAEIADPRPLETRLIVRRSTGPAPATSNARDQTTP